MKKKKAISLIILVVTIIVMAILATTVIVTLANTNIIGEARKTAFKSDMQSYKQAYELYVTEKTMEIGDSFDNSKLNVTYNDELFSTIFGNVPSKYQEGLKISEGKLVYETDDEEERKILDDFGMTRESKVKFSAYINGQVKINCPQSGLSCKGERDSTFNSYCNIGESQTHLSLVSGLRDPYYKPTIKEDENKVSKWVKATDEDYFHKTFNLKWNWENEGSFYLADIKATNVDSSKPVTSTVWIYLKSSNSEYIFKLSDDQNTQKNTLLPEGCVIDTARSVVGGSSVPATSFSKEAYATYNTSTSEASLKMDTLPLGRMKLGDTISIEMYVYVEAGSGNFGWNLNDGAIKDFELTFVGIQQED